MNDEEKSVLELNNDKCLLDLCFIVDIVGKLIKYIITGKRFNLI